MCVLHDKFEQFRSRLTDHLLHTTRQVAKLSEEIFTLREVIAEFKAPPSTEPPSPLDHKPDLPPAVVWIEHAKPVTETPLFKNQSAEALPEVHSKEVRKPDIDFSVLPIEDMTERKVAFFAK